MNGATTVQMIGAGLFGAVLGWQVYAINRYRTGEVKLSDLVTLVGAIGGAAILAVFPAHSDLFGAYGIGLFIGFFAYLAALGFLVRRTNGAFTAAWFLDGRRRKPAADEVIPQGTGVSVHPMLDESRGTIAG